MGIIEKSQLLDQVCPPLDYTLTNALVDEFVSMEKRFIQRDWEPTELDGGQFCEILSRILYHQDSGNKNYNKSVKDCIRYIENKDVNHELDTVCNAGHLCLVIKTIYKFRSQRGAIHISPTYKANHMDSRYLMDSTRWLMNETLRIFWNSDRELVAKAIRELIQFDVPCIGKYDDVILVQRLDLNAEEEILILLHYAGDGGFSRNEIGLYSFFKPSTITNTLNRLKGSEYREIIQLSNQKFRLTDLGSKRIREDLSNKLVL
jgi:hypothetical protein